MKAGIYLGVALFVAAVVFLGRDLLNHHFDGGDAIILTTVVLFAVIIVMDR